LADDIEKVASVSRTVQSWAGDESVDVRMLMS
jgi:hypothetical protein